MTAQSSISAASGGIRPTGLINGTSSFGITSCPPTLLGPITSAGQKLAGVVVVPSGDCTANTLITVLSVVGRGVISCLLMAAINSTGRTQRIKVTLDGVVIFDATSFITQNNAGSVTACVIGGVFHVTSDLNGTSSVSMPIYEPLLFNASLLVEYSSSLTEINAARIAYRYMPR